MPHLFVNRPRRYGLGRIPPEDPAHVRWELLNATLYNIGGGVFIGGSVLFLPRFAAFADVGVWAFLVGSLAYLVVTLHDVVEVSCVRASASAMRPWRYRLELAAALTYLAGTVLFVVGSVFFFSWVDRLAAGAWCFVIGSLLFVLGAAVNVLHVVVARSLLTLQLMNLTAVSFLAGSVLFTVASVPYLFTWASPTDRDQVLAFLAWQYIAGSALFLLGGLFNLARARLVAAASIA